MPYYKKTKSMSYSRGRRLQVSPAVVAGALAVGKKVVSYVKKRQADVKKRKENFLKINYRKSVSARQDRISQSDNILSLATTTVGKPRVPTFEEKVRLVERPGIQFKRQYAFSAECTSGRKAWFSIDINRMNSDDLLNDISAYKSAQTTDTGIGDPAVTGNDVSDTSQYYVDLCREKLQFVNSSSNSITGKIHLFG